MTTYINTLGLLIILILTGCSSTPRYNLNVPLSEAAKAAASTSSIDNNINATPSFSGLRTSGHVQSHIHVVSEPFFFNDGLNLTSLDSRVTLYRTLPTSLSDQGYTLLSGFQLSLAGRDSQIQYRFSLSYAPGVFSPPNNTGLRDLHLFALSGDISAIHELNNVAFEVGGRIGTGVASFAFATPIVLSGTEIDGDGIGTFFIAIPFGLQIDLGAITLESQIAPTLTFHNAETEVGFDNDIAFSKWTIPLAFGVGFNF